MTDFIKHNEMAWDRKVEARSPWTIPVSHEEIENAKSGDWSIILTPQKAVPRDWFPVLDDAHVLCLASAGGQQGPVLAAAGARVTVLDFSRRQLDQDAHVARRESLSLETVKGDMRDLSQFADETFDFIVHPCSNHCVEDVSAVWKESYRVLKKGCAIISGFTNPILYMIDEDLAEASGVLRLKHSVPYADIEQLAAEELQEMIEAQEVLEFGHTLEQLIGGQIDAGFIITGFYEDSWGTGNKIDNFCNSFIATRAVKM